MTWLEKETIPQSFSYTTEGHIFMCSVGHRTNDFVIGDHWESFEIPNRIKYLMCIHKYVKPQKVAVSKISGSPEKKPRAKSSEERDNLHWELVFQKTLKKATAN